MKINKKRKYNLETNNDSNDSETNYGKKFKLQLNIQNIQKQNMNNEIKTFSNLKKIRNSELTKKILDFPDEIQKKIYIFAMKHFYKFNYSPLISQVPTWYSYQLDVQNQISECYFKNIHFLHLEMNTLPKNKKYILGCQCKFCINHKDKEIYKDIIFLSNEQFIKKILKMNDYNWYDINYWNQYENDYNFKIFNPFYESIHNYSFEFS